MLQARILGGYSTGKEVACSSYDVEIRRRSLSWRDGARLLAKKGMQRVIQSSNGSTQQQRGWRGKFRLGEIAADLFRCTTARSWNQVQEGQLDGECVPAGGRSKGHPE